MVKNKKNRIVLKLVVCWLMVGYSLSVSGEVLKSKATVNVISEETTSTIEPPQTTQGLNNRLPQTNEKKDDFSILFLILLLVLSSYHVIDKLQMKRMKEGNIK